MVRGLQTYMERYCKTVCKLTDIEELVMKFKVDNDGKDACILINLRSLLRGFTYCEDNSWIFGGQLKELVDNSIKFVEDFEKIGAKLVFFDGSVTVRKFPIWHERCRQGARSAAETVQFLEEGKSIESVHVDPRLIPEFFVEITKFVFKSMRKCEVVTPPASRECDEAMADYARAHNSFAILACDSDFVIYNAADYYLTTRHLDLKTMTTVRYDSEALADQLQFPVECLPLFATLLGNDVIPRADLVEFHNSLSFLHMPHWRQQPSKNLIENVARYVREFRDLDEVTKNLPRIARLVFRADNMEAVIETSIKSYLPSPAKEEEPSQGSDCSEWEQIQAKAEELVAEVKLFKHVITPITDFAVTYGVTLEAFGLNDLPDSISVTLPLRRRFYGVMLFEHPGGPGTVEEWTGGASSAGEDEAEKVEPIPPEPGRIHASAW